MNSGQATGVKLSEVVVSRNGDIHASIEPNVPELGIIFDAHGDPVTPKTRLMDKIDDRVTSPIKMSFGLASLLGVGITILSAIVGAWLYSLTGAMSYQTVVSRVGTVETRVEKIEKVLDDMQGLKVASVTMQKDVQAIREKQMADEQDRKKMIDNIADIRILLAQKGIGQ